MCMQHLRAFASNHWSWGLLALRLAVGSVFLFHGIQKWALWGEAPSSASLTPNMLNIMKFLSIVEPLGGAALILGFLTQFAAIGLGLIMLGAIYFKMQVWNMPFAAQSATGWEFDLVLLAASIQLLFSGAGKYSLDGFMKKSS